MKPLLIIFSFLLFSTSAFSQQPTQEEKVSEVFDIQKMPSFPGGEAALFKFLADNLYYTPAAYEQNLQGTVALSFVVEKDGSLSDMKVLKDIGGGLGEIAANVMRSSPKWIPGEANGHPTRVRFTLPVRYLLGITSVKSEQVSPKKEEPAATEKEEPAETKPAEAPLDENKIYEFAEADTKPEYPGGKTEMYKFLAKSINYPAAARQKNKQGSALYEFTVEKDGAITNIRILSDPGFGMGAEGLRIIQLLPKWTPGAKNGVPVRVNYSMPIEFKLQ